MAKSPRDSATELKFELLKELLLEDDRKDLKELKEEVHVKEKLSVKVSPLVDEKIEDLRRNFPEYFGETITETIKSQIRDSQDEVVEALYPIIGKLVKKFIIREIEKLSEKVNQTVEESLSVSGLMKRFFGGKKTDGDALLQETFEPVIEEVFIIKKDSGLLIGNYFKGSIADKDMVSGMFTAIKAFAEDAFAKEAQDLEDIRFETFQISIKNFKTLYIAIVTSGVLNSFHKDELTDNINRIAEIILRDRSYLSDSEKINTLIEAELINQFNPK